MQKKLGIVLISLALTSSALGQAARYIDPMLGVDGGGNTFPGPSLAFRMIKPGPDLGDNKGNAGWKSNGNINGFSRTHVNGAGGGPKYGNILIQPTTGIPRAGNCTETGVGLSCISDRSSTAAVSAEPSFWRSNHHMEHLCISPPKSMFPIPTPPNRRSSAC